MVHLQTSLLSFLVIGQTTAHFLLHYPTTIGFDDDLEGEAPCGSFTPDFSTDNITNFGVAGNAIALTSIHPQATWLFRATLDLTASGNWTSLLPAITQKGLGDYCEQDVTVPASWAGSKGIISIVQDAPDGILYQCAAVNFVAGTIAPPSVCTNVTGLAAVYTTDTVLSNLPASATSSGASTSATGASTTTGSGGSTTTSAASTASTKASAATTVRTFEGLGLLAWTGMIAFAGLGAFLI